MEAQAITMKKLVNNVLDSAILDHEDCPFQAALFPGHEQVFVIGGANATGKSLMARIIGAHAAAEKITSISVSIRERTDSGGFEMAAMRRNMMFGDETEQSTGSASVRTVKTAFRSSANYPSILVLDEPELGLSPGYARALGLYIGQQALVLPEACYGLVVVTHDRGLGEALQEALGTKPSFICMDSPAVDFDSWLHIKEDFSLADLESLEDRNLDGFRRTSKIMQALEEEARAEKKSGRR